MLFPPQTALIKKGNSQMTRSVQDIPVTEANDSFKLQYAESQRWSYTVYWGRILERNWDKSLKSSPSCYSQSPILTDFTPPPQFSKSGLKLVCNVNTKHYIRKPQAWELSRLCPETSTKLYVHDFGFCSGSTDLGFWEVFCLEDFFMPFLHTLLKNAEAESYATLAWSK